MNAAFVGYRTAGPRTTGLRGYARGFVLFFTLTLGLALLPGRPAQAQFAKEVVKYDPGIGYAVEFGSGLGYTNTATVLGEPSRVTTSAFGSSAVDPFSAPYTRDQLLSLGTNGLVTVRLDTPIFDDPANPFGIDFLLFGNAGFVITNGDYAGGGITSGALYGANPGATRVSVSADGVTFYPLDPTHASTVDGAYPTDGSGDFLRPVDPALRAEDFSGLGLEGIRARYAGSGGGMGFDLGWARTATGEPAGLKRAEYVRLEVQSGKAEVDAVAVVLDHGGAGFTETFRELPLLHGWQVFGDASLFAWDPDRGSLLVTWDSRRTNSFLHRPLGTVLTAGDDFALAFDLELESVQAGIRPEKPSTFQIAVGLFNRAEAERTNFFRAAGVAETGARSVLEWNYFPDTGFGATLSPSVFATNNATEISFTFPFELRPGPTYRVVMQYTATNRVLRTTMLADGVPMPAIKEVVLPEEATFDFRLDTVAIASYSDAGQAGGEFDGSILARGWVDNVRVTLPSADVLERLQFRDGAAEIVFQGRRAWRYTLERSTDSRTWESAATWIGQSNAAVVVRDTLPAVASAIYRVRADAP